MSERLTLLAYLRRGVLGYGLDVGPDGMIISIVVGEQADQDGLLQAGDQVIEVDGEPLNGHNIRSLIARRDTGQGVELKFRRLDVELRQQVLQQGLPVSGVAYRLVKAPVRRSADGLGIDLVGSMVRTYSAITLEDSQLKSGDLIHSIDGKRLVQNKVAPLLHPARAVHIFTLLRGPLPLAMPVEPDGDPKAQGSVEVADDQEADNDVHQGPWEPSVRLTHFQSAEHSSYHIAMPKPRRKWYQSLANKVDDKVNEDEGDEEAVWSLPLLGTPIRFESTKAVNVQWAVKGEESGNLPFDTRTADEIATEKASKIAAIIAAEISAARAVTQKAAAERASTERAVPGRAAAGRAEVQSVAVGNATSEHATVEKTAVHLEKAAAEEAAIETAVTEREATDKAAGERVAFDQAAERAAAEKAAAERVVAERAEAEERVAVKKVAEAEEKATAELEAGARAAARRVLTEKIAAERSEAERVMAAGERAAAKQFAAERVEAARLRAERVEAEIAAAERDAVERAAERMAVQRAVAASEEVEATERVMRTTAATASVARAAEESTASCMKRSLHVAYSAPNTCDGGHGSREFIFWRRAYMGVGPGARSQQRETMNGPDEMRLVEDHSHPCHCQGVVAITISIMAALLGREQRT
jgi:hypothetical protein